MNKIENCTFASTPAPGIPNADDLSRAISHAVNYHGLDAKLNMADYVIADPIAPEVLKHLSGMTDTQMIERMSPEDRANIGRDQQETTMCGPEDDDH